MNRCLTTCSLKFLFLCAFSKETLSLTKADMVTTWLLQQIGFLSTSLRLLCTIPRSPGTDLCWFKSSPGGHTLNIVGDLEVVAEQLH